MYVYIYIYIYCVKCLLTTAGQAGSQMREMQRKVHTLLHRKMHHAGPYRLKGETFAKRLAAIRNCQQAFLFLVGRGGEFGAWAGGALPAAAIVAAIVGAVCASSHLVAVLARLAGQGGWLAGCPRVCLPVCMAGCLAGCLAACLAGCLAVWGIRKEGSDQKVMLESINSVCFPHNSTLD